MQKNDHVIMEDVSNGMEFVKIPVINNINNAEVQDFSYRLMSRAAHGATVIREKEEAINKHMKDRYCDCKDKICNPLTCRCEHNSTIVFNKYDRIVMWPHMIDYNKTKYVECDHNCACRGKCKRQILPRGKVHKKVFVKYFENKGFGVVADQLISVGMPIMEYTGLYITWSEAEINSVYSEYHLTAISECEDSPELIIDAKSEGNVSRFLNHSCTPNLCMLRTYSANPGNSDLSPLPRVIMIALRPIKPGDELTFTYDVNYFARELKCCLCYEHICFVPPEDYVDERKHGKQWAAETEETERLIRQNFQLTADLQEDIEIL